MIDGFGDQRINGLRVVLRKSVAADLEGLVQSQVDPELRRYLGGSRPGDQVHSFFQHSGVAGATACPGSFIIAEPSSDLMLGKITLARRDASLPGHVVGDGSELELSYVLLPGAWGQGYVTEAASALLHTAATALPDQPVLIVTQSANLRSLAVAKRLGFRLVEEFEQFEAVQSLLVADLKTVRRRVATARPSVGANRDGWHMTGFEVAHGRPSGARFAGSIHVSSRARSATPALLRLTGSRSRLEACGWATEQKWQRRPRRLWQPLHGSAEQLRIQQKARPAW
jgi:RimJ/RimL family protein N-acetyltransferase